MWLYMCQPGIKLGEQACVCSHVPRTHRFGVAPLEYFVAKCFPSLRVSGWARCAWVIVLVCLSEVFCRLMLLSDWR